MEDFYKLSSSDEERVQNIHKNIKIFDGLATSYLDKEYIQILKEVGVNTVHYTVAFTNFTNGQQHEDNLHDACSSIARWNRIMEENADEVEQATSIAEMEDIWSRGKIAIFYGFQNGSPLEDNLSFLKLYYQIDHYVDIVGIDNVTIGTDFSGTVTGLAEADAQINAIRAKNPKAYLGKRVKPKGFDRIDGLYNVTRGLVKHGYSDEDIAKIYSLNMRRVLKVIFNEK